MSGPRVTFEQQTAEDWIWVRQAWCQFPCCDRPAVEDHATCELHNYQTCGVDRCGAYGLHDKTLLNGIVERRCSKHWFRGDAA